MCVTRRYPHQCSHSENAVGNVLNLIPILEKIVPSEKSRDDPYKGVRSAIEYTFPPMFKYAVIFNVYIVQELC